jgi:hypothetical protein
MSRVVEIELPWRYLPLLREVNDIDTRTCTFTLACTIEMAYTYRWDEPSECVKRMLLRKNDFMAILDCPLP